MVAMEGYNLLGTYLVLQYFQPWVNTARKPVTHSQTCQINDNFLDSYEFRVVDEEFNN
jgi:hypothetical protein